MSYATVPVEREMTVQELPRHTSGLAYGELTQNEPVEEGYAAAGAYAPDGMAFDARGVEPEAQVAALAKAPLAHQPGTVWEDSFASDVLGRVIEAASGMRLADSLEDRLVAPLGMKDAGFSVPQEAAARLAEPFAFDPDSGAPVPLIDVGAAPANDPGGAGAVASAGDHLRLAQMLLDGGALDGARVLSPTTVRLMASDHLGPDVEVPVEPGELLMGTPGCTFGLGFMVRRVPGIAGVAGSQGELMWAGYGGTFFWVDPAEDLVAVLMAQRAGPSRAHHRKLVKPLVHQAITDSAQEPVPRQAVAVRAAVIPAARSGLTRRRPRARSGCRAPAAMKDGLHACDETGGRPRGSGHRRLRAAPPLALADRTGASPPVPPRGGARRPEPRRHPDRPVAQAG